MSNFKTYIMAMISHVVQKTKEEQVKLAQKKVTGLPQDKSELHYLDGMHAAFQTVLKHIEEIENEHA